MGFTDYINKKIEEVFEILKSSPDGLTEKEAERRIDVYGQNEAKTKEVTSWDIFVKQIKSPFAYLLFIAAIISFLVSDWLGGVVVLIFVSINITIGFFQENKAHKASSLLKEYIPDEAKVLRDGEKTVIDKKFLVPGDVVLLGLGDIAPADLRIIKEKSLLVDEGILTGESIPISKTSEALKEETAEIFKANNIVFSGSSIVSGEMVGIVVGTGREMVIGEVATLISSISRESLYEKDLIKFSKIILRVVIITILSIFTANLFIKGGKDLLSFLLFCIAIVVAILPEALPLIVTFSFSKGALKLAKEKVIVKRLLAVGDLGNIEILCSDKTGTLTENKLELEKIDSYDENRCLTYGLLTSSYFRERVESSLNPFDAALEERASDKIIKDLKEYKVIEERPFDPNHRKSSAILEDKDGRKYLIVKGAPEVMLKSISIWPEKENSNSLKEKTIEAGKEGRRVLVVAFKEIENEEDPVEREEKNLTHLGFFSFFDPLKKTAKESVCLAQKLGVRVKIITGDSMEVAGRIAKDIGLIDDEKKVLLGETVESLTEKGLEKACAEYDVFARVSPQVKYKIVKKLGEKYEVGFLGDGINDAPALKAAHVAIAVSNAVGVAREASDIILLEKDLGVIVEGIKHGRSIFANIHKYIVCTLSGNFGNFFSIALISLFVPFLPILPVQVLLINLLSDLPLVAVASDNVDPDRLKRPKLYQLNGAVPLIIMMALVSSIFDFIFFGLFYKANPSLIQTTWFMFSILTELVFIFSIRTHHFFLKAKRPSKALLLTSLVAFVTTIVLPLTGLGRKVFSFSNPSLETLLLMLGLVLAYFVVGEGVKIFYYKYRDKKEGEELQIS